MARKIDFFTGGIIMRAHDAVYILEGEDLREALVEAAIDSISTDVEIRVGEVTMHLAGWMNPDQWDEDWREKGIEDVDALLAEAVASG